MPAVTVLMAAHNEEQHVREAVESILQQTFTDFEFVIIDDGSSDGTCDILHSFQDPRIRLVNNLCRIGLTKSLNRGLEMSRGEYVARQDADDISRPDRLEKQVACLRNLRQVVLLGSQARYLYERPNFLRLPDISRATTDCGIQWQMMTYSAFIHSSVMYRRRVIWDELHGYNEAFLRRQDYELWSRVVPSYPVMNLPDTLLDLRVHRRSVSSNYARDDVLDYSPVILSNMRRYLREADVPAEWAQLIAWMNNPRLEANVEHPERLAGVIRSMWQRFLLIWPDAHANKELRRQVAWDHVRAALCLLTRDRRASLNAWWRALRIDGRFAARCSPRYICLLILGETIPRALAEASRR